MLNKTEKAPAKRNSKTIAKARRNRLLITPRAFKHLHNGVINMHKTQDVYFCGFSSAITGKRAHAWGDTFGKSYRNMIRNFNQKYVI